MLEDDQIRIERIILQLLKDRGNGKSICPSEAARHIARLNSQPDDWRKWLKLTQTTAALMAKRGTLIMLQRGKRVDPDNIHGPIRLVSV